MYSKQSIGSSVMNQGLAWNTYLIDFVAEAKILKMLQIQLSC